MKKRDKIFLAVIILTIIISVIVVLVFYFSKNNIIKLENNDKEKLGEQTSQSESVIQNEAKSKYPNFKWVSDGNFGKINAGVENGKVYIVIKQDGSKTYLNFDKGTPKYAGTVLKGGMLSEMFVITIDGDLYIADCSEYGKEGFEFKFNLQNLGEKVIDATYADGTEIYYLLQNGTLFNDNGPLVK